MCLQILLLFLAFLSLKKECTNFSLSMRECANFSLSRLEFLTKLTGANFSPKFSRMPGFLTIEPKILIMLWNSHYHLGGTGACRAPTSPPPITTAPPIQNWCELRKSHLKYPIISMLMQHWRTWWERVDNRMLIKNTCPPLHCCWWSHHQLTPEIG